MYSKLNFLNDFITIRKFIFILPFLRLDQLFVSTKAQPAFDWTQIQHMFWTILLVQFGEHDQLASKHFPRMMNNMFIADKVSINNI